MSKNTYRSEIMRKVVVVTNSAGDIIASAGTSEASSLVIEAHANQLETGIKALPNQSVHVVEMPDSFFECRTAIEKHRWASRYRIVLDPEPRLMERHDVLESERKD